MRKTTTALFALALCIGSPAHARGPKKFWSVTKEIIRQAVPNVRFPAVEQVTGIHAVGNGYGAGIEAHRFVISDGTGIPGPKEVFAYSAFLGTIEGGGALYDTRKWDLGNQQIPVLVRVYGADGHFIGFARHVFYAYAQYPQPQSWVVQPEEIIRYDGQPIYNLMGYYQLYPHPLASGEQKVEIPKQFGDTTFTQVANSSAFTVRLQLDGQEVALLAPGQIFSHKDEVVGPSYWGRSHVLTVTWLEGEKGAYRFVRQESYQFSISSQGALAHQFIVGPLWAWQY